MFSEQLFDLILNLDDEWKVELVKANFKTEEVDVYVEYIGKEAQDPDTFEMYPIYDHAPSRRWRHLDTMQYKTYINCCVPRVKTPSGKIKTIKTPWADSYERHTYLFERLAIDVLLSTKNQTKTAKLLRCGFNVINRIIYNSVDRGLKNRPKDYYFEHLSVDEKSFKKGHNYVTVLSDPLSGVVIDVSENRDYVACIQVFEQTIKHEHKNKVKTVSMDMWQSYINATKNFLPNAEIVHDKFHLVKCLNEAIDKVRKREVRHNEELKNTKYLFLKNLENHTEKQRIKFESIAKANYEVSRAWRIKENFRDIFGCESLDEAFSLVMQWIGNATHAKIDEITKVVDTFKKHLRGIINAMLSTFTNAMAERLNGKIQEVKACARGYRRFENFRSAILFFYGGLYLYPLN
ncbi:MAG TPA: ISL3 family transposase [Bacteroidales bacterium]|nr:ISL3 family transposase [Bacteroidales bacterium]